MTNKFNLSSMMVIGMRKFTQKRVKDKNFPHAKVYFEKYIMNIDLSMFNNDLNEEKFTSNIECKM